MIKIISLVLFILSACAHKKVPVQIFDVKAGAAVIEISPGDVKQLKIKLDSDEVVKELKCSNEVIKFKQEIGEQNVLWFYYAQDYFVESGEFLCVAKIGDNDKNLIQIKVKPKQFGEESLRVSPKKVNLSKKDLKRSAEERVILDEVYRSTLNEPFYLRDFVAPMKSKLTSVYGTKRVFNQTRQGQHLGVDYKAAVGDEIFSSNAGKIILARNLFFSGNTVIIDHGMGILTVYMHMSKLLVQAGDYVPQFSLLGLAGSTGRVTGPHLHWGVKVNGHWVDGLTLLAIEGE
jgi:murein DD-endopeptidase MepM/ murein hydrolase activator NlpD